MSGPESDVERAAKAEKVIEVVEAFVKAEHIRCSESVYQSDNVILNAYEFIEKLCDIAGYHEDEDEEPPEPDAEDFRGGEAAAYEAEQMAEARKLK